MKSGVNIFEAMADENRTRRIAGRRSLLRTPDYILERFRRVVIEAIEAQARLDEDANPARIVVAKIHRFTT